MTHLMLLFWNLFVVWYTLVYHAYLTGRFSHGTWLGDYALGCIVDTIGLNFLFIGVSCAGVLLFNSVIYTFIGSDFPFFVIAVAHSFVASIFSLFKLKGWF